jgi:hypothetical protein
MVTGMNATRYTDRPVPGHGPAWHRAPLLAVILTGAVLAGCGSSSAAPAAKTGSRAPAAALTSLNIQGHTFPITTHHPAVISVAACGQTLVALSKTIGAAGSTPTAAWLQRYVGMVLDPAGGASSAQAAVQYISTTPADQSCFVATGAAEMTALSGLASMPSAASQMLTTPQPKSSRCTWTVAPHGRQANVSGHCSSTTGNSSKSNFIVAEIFPSRWFVVAETSGSSVGTSAG